MRKKLKDRNTIETKYKWNLRDIYSSWAEWDKEMQELKSLLVEAPKYKGKIKESAEIFLEVEELTEKISRKLDKLYLYPYMLKDLDSTDEMASIKMQEIEMSYAQFATQMAWLAPETLEIPEGQMRQWIESHPKLQERKFPLLELYRLQKHVLEEGKEELLSYYSQFLGSSSDIYAELSISDMKWNLVRFSKAISSAESYFLALAVATFFCTMAL